MPLWPIVLHKVYIPVLDIGTVYRADVAESRPGLPAGQPRRVVFGSLEAASEGLRELGYYIRKVDTTRARKEAV